MTDNIGSNLFPDAEMVREAELSSCGKFRFSLIRSWADEFKSGATLNFVMLNPSTADATNDDPTIRRCMGFARRWGYDEIAVTNIYPFRATSPVDLKRAPDKLGPRASPMGKRTINEMRIHFWASYSTLVVCAWGAHAEPDVAARALAEIRSAGKTPHYLRLTKEGHPNHPLYLPGDLSPIPWRDAP